MRRPARRIPRTSAARCAACSSTSTLHPRLDPQSAHVGSSAQGRPGARRRSKPSLPFLREEAGEEDAARSAARCAHSASVPSWRARPRHVAAASGPSERSKVGWRRSSAMPASRTTTAPTGTSRPSSLPTSTALHRPSGTARERLCAAGRHRQGTLGPSRWTASFEPRGTDDVRASVRAPLGRSDREPVR
jgi:hypothetical protein